MRMKDFKTNVWSLESDDSDWLLDVRKRVCDSNGDYDYEYLGADGLDEMYNDYEVVAFVPKIVDGMSAIELTIEAPSKWYTFEVSVNCSSNIAVNAKDEDTAYEKAVERFCRTFDRHDLKRKFDDVSDIHVFLLDEEVEAVRK